MRKTAHQPYMTYFNQAEFDIRCEWGAEGVSSLGPGSDAVIIVDVLSFSTAVDIAVSNGAIVYPFRWRDDSAVAFAGANDALLAHPRQDIAEGYSLSPNSLVKIPTGTRLVLPSPNGSTLTLMSGEVPTFAGCLRNAAAVARATEEVGSKIAVIPAGERWEDGSLRPALEDLIGAGAIIHHLKGTRSPEAELAEAAFLRFRDDLWSCLSRSSSGKELIGEGWQRDVELAADYNRSDTAPVLLEGAYR